MVCWTAIPAVVVLLSLISEIFCDCDRDQGPSGGTECVLLNPLYSEYQYASCLTDSYIRARSGGKHACLDHYAAYCYYQCMLELNNIQYGNIFLKNSRIKVSKIYTFLTYKLISFHLSTGLLASLNFDCICARICCVCLYILYLFIDFVIAISNFSSFYFSSKLENILTLNAAE